MPFVCKAVLFAAGLKLRRIIWVGNAACMKNLNNSLENLKRSENMKDRILYEEILILKFLCVPKQDGNYLTS